MSSVRSGWYIFVVNACFCFLFINSAFAQEPSDIEEAWTKQLGQELGSPPERAGMLLEPLTTLQNLPVPSPPFNRYLSLLITDVDTVNAFKFSDLMDHLAKQGNVTKEVLFHQWWDTQNQDPGFAADPHCNDLPPQDKLGHFKYDCPRYEGYGTPANTNPNTPAQPAQATDPNVFTGESIESPQNSGKYTIGLPDAYSPIAISNRFDLFTRVPPQDDGKFKYPDCGEYRIIFARNSGRTIAASQSTDNKDHTGDPRNRILISFEFRVPNPSSEAESAADKVPNGCLPILRFFNSLSQTTSGKNRGGLLKAFFMTGEMKAPDGTIFGHLTSNNGVADIHNIAFRSGQIRTNQFLNLVKDTAPVLPTYTNPAGSGGVVNHSPNNWILREYRALPVANKVLIVPVTTKSNPDVYLFNPATGDLADPRIRTLIADIEKEYIHLLGGGNLNDPNAILYQAANSVTNGYQSVTGSPQPCAAPSTCDPTPVDDIVAAANANPYLISDIQLYLQSHTAPPGIGAINIIDRLRTQTCAGCHQFSDTQYKTNTNNITVGYDPRGQLGGDAVWPVKACGDYAPQCTLANFIIKDYSANPKLHPPMQFTQVSEVILIPSAADTDKNHFRYSISSTAECLLDSREALMGTVLGFKATTRCPPIPRN